MSIKYPYIPSDRQILYVSIDNAFMKEAIETAKNFSTDKMQSTGAVIVKNGEIVSRGANQTFLKNENLQKIHRNGLCFRKVLKIQSGTKYWLCPGCSGHGSHAEAQATFNALKNNVDIKGADLYLWGHWWCCKPCWDKMIEAGIKNVYLAENSEKLFKARHPDNILGKVRAGS
jgi:deoxycytidylate deaminase